MTPRTIIWIFTAKCNLRCPHCYASIFEGEEELGLEEKLLLIREAGESGVEHIGLSGGEPLIHPDLPIMLREISDYGMTVSLVTNATVLGRDVLDALARYDVYVYVSLDGPRHVHEWIRGRGTYDRVLETIYLLRRYGVDYGFVMAVGRHNYMHARDYVGLAEDLGADHAALIPVMPVGRALINHLWVRAREYLFAVRNALDRAMETGYQLSFWCTPFLDLITSYGGAWTYYCRIANVVDISPSGDLLLCDVLSYRVASVRGNGLRRALEKYYVDPVVKEIVRPSRLPSQCMKCRLRDLCRGGCYARSYVLRGDYNMGDPLCPRISGIEDDDLLY